LVPEPVQRAIRKLDGLLGRAGVSAGVLEGLRRTLEQLRVVGGGAVEAEVAALQGASRELEGCLGLIRASSGGADRELEEDVAKAHRRIGRLVRPAEGAAVSAPAAPAASPWIAGGTTVLPSLPASPLPPPPLWEPPPRAPEVVRQPPIVVPPPKLEELVPAPAAAPVAPDEDILITEDAVDERVIDGIAARLGASYRRRCGELADPLLTWEELDAIDARLARQLKAVTWLGEGGKAVGIALAQAEGEEARAWLAANQASTASQEPALAQLLAALDDPDDTSAIRAALALAWVGPFDMASALLARAEAASAPRRAAFLFTATALGSPVALELVRDEVDRAAEVDVQLIDALAVAGDAADGQRLLRRAAGEDASAAAAALTIGHLGSPAATLELGRPRGLVDDRILDHARRLTFGEANNPPASSGRLLGGKAWSVTGVLTRLAAPDEPVRSRERLALELGVRTGFRPPGRYDARAPAQQQRQMAEAFAAAFAPRASQLQAGRWYHAGRAALTPR
jgi:hypothetical protein